MSKEVIERFAGPVVVTPADMVVDIHVKLRESLTDARMGAYVEGFYGSVVEKARQVGGPPEVMEAIISFFYPALDGKQLTGFLNRELFGARTYQVTGEIVDAVSGTFRNSAARIGYLQQEELPYPSGFVWLDKPFLVTDVSGQTVAVRAISWSPQSIIYPGEQKGTTRTVPGLRTSTWARARDRDDFYSEKSVILCDAVNSELILSHTQVVPFGQRFGGHPQDNFDWTPDDFLHWVHVLWCFMETEITVYRDAPLSRPAWRRARGLKESPRAVNVVQLRRRSYTSAGSDAEVQHREVDWSCQWVVQGHHRHLEKYEGAKHHAVVSGSDREHCVTCGVRVTWVHAHIKGPEGAPLRSAEQLYRLER
jgi:hypothetical protein